MNKKLISSLAVVMLFVGCFIPSTRLEAEEVPVVPVVEPAPEQVPSPEAAPQTPEEIELMEQQIVAQAVASVVAEQESRQLIFIGDSRTVGMKSAIGNDGNIWSAKVAMGLSWMKNTGVPAVEANINENTDVVILMGVNDCRNTSYTKKYISYINDKANLWTTLGANVYYVSVNPVTFESKKYPGISNTVIEKWNTAMVEGLNENVSYIDTYSTVLGNLSSKDGIHYNKSSYQLLYTLIKQGIMVDKLAKEYQIVI